MPDTSLLPERSRTALEPASVPAPTAFEQLRALLRNGYAPDGEQEAGSAILMRHAQAPDLLLHPDGRIELPSRQSPKRKESVAEPARPRMSKRRTFVIVVMAAIIWFFSAYFTAGILEGM